MNRKRVWRLCTLLPDLPGESEVASLRVPGPSGIHKRWCARNLCGEPGGEFLSGSRPFGERMR